MVQPLPHGQSGQGSPFKRTLNWVAKADAAVIGLLPKNFVSCEPIPKGSLDYGSARLPIKRWTWTKQALIVLRGPYLAPVVIGFRGPSKSARK